ncbi:MAG: hypothetical protein DRJ07_15120, partial [Bacteroidetes bacterium]
MSKSLYNNTTNSNKIKNELSIKERSNLYKLSGLFREDKDDNYILKQACIIIADFFKYKSHINIRIRYGKYKYCKDSNNFIETKWKLEKSFQTIYQNKGMVEVFYTKEFPPADKGSFSTIEINYLKKATTLLKSYINNLEASQEIDSQIWEGNNSEPHQQERLKELACISIIEDRIKAKKSIDITLQEICYEIRKTMQYSDYIVARILFNNKVYSAPKEFADTTIFYTVWTLREAFSSNNANGVIVVYSIKEMSKKNSSPFSKEEKRIVKKIASIVQNYISDYKRPLDILKTK